MESVESAGIGTDLPLEALRSALDGHPVRLAVLFGSHARGAAHARSDIDIAVELEGLHPGKPGFNEAFFALSADLAEALGTDDVDVVDVHTLASPLVGAVFDDGVLLVGSERRAATVRRQLETGRKRDRSPRDRFDEALRLIDEHLA